MESQDKMLYRLEYYPRKGTFHTTPSLSHFIINDGWTIIDYEQDPDLYLSFIKYMYTLCPQLNDGTDFPLPAERIQAEWLLYRYKIHFSIR